MDSFRCGSAEGVWVSRAAAKRTGAERAMRNELLGRMERLIPGCDAAVGELLWPVIEAIRCREWEGARAYAVEFLESTPQVPLNERLFEYQLQQLLSTQSNADVVVEVDVLSKLRVLVRRLVLGDANNLAV